ncbi:hypothetical protein A6U87_24395 [Rhizobium sp. AC44/96]|uniref:hypothetical protein n=1 Tax=Rhizobium sp. AC44/96 TaxID=1841654 RepID=UPI00080F8B5E|nr:hypothetical protein [Rhizobium sp. AC44/96]OCJ15267.1 hypothetical protein A6U87_24395 [Rhizobium sp. AC44/96]
MTLTLLMIALSAVFFWYAQGREDFDQAVNYGKKASLLVRALVLVSMPGSVVFHAACLVNCLRERNLKIGLRLVVGTTKGYVSFLKDCLEVVFMGQVAQTRRSQVA